MSIETLIGTVLALQLLVTFSDAEISSVLWARHGNSSLRDLRRKR